MWEMSVIDKFKIILFAGGVCVTIFGNFSISEPEGGGHARIKRGGVDFRISPLNIQIY